MSGEKGSKSKRKVRILAVKRPRTGIDVAEEELPESPYVTLEQFYDRLGLVPGDLDGQENLGPEHYVAIGLAIQAQMSENPDLEMGQLLTVMMSEVGVELFDGVYAPTKANPVYAMQTFLTFRQLRMYPPSWVLEWLAKAFDGYLKSEGDEDLNELLGVKRGPGQTPAFKEANAISRESELMLELGLLTTANATIEQAAEMVFAGQEELDSKCPSVDTLAARFSKRGWSKYFKQIKEISPSLSIEDAKEAFAAYPPHSIPAKFK